MSNEKEATPTPTGKSWFVKGDQGFEQKHKNDKVAAARREKGVRRFYLKSTAGTNPAQPDNKARIVVLDSEIVWINEHRLQIGKTYDNYFTCTEGMSSAPCPICAQLQNRPTFTGYFTVVDTRKFINKQTGKESAWRKVLFPAKGEAINLIEELRKKHGNLRGLVLDVTRHGERSANCGTHFDIVLTKDNKVARVDPAAKFGAEGAVPYDYNKVLCPPTVEELEMAGVAPVVTVGSAEDVDLDASAATPASDSLEDLDV
jgi:hypothetical protein